MVSVKQQILRQRSFYLSGGSTSVERIMRTLKALQTNIKAKEWEILAAIETDMDRPPYETFMMECLPIYRQIKYNLKHLRRWHQATQHHAKTALGRLNYEQSSKPYGVVLLIGDPVHPLRHVLMPLIDAITAGNTVLIRPDAAWQHFTNVIDDVLRSVFPTEWVYVNEDRYPIDQWIAGRPDLIVYLGDQADGVKVQQLAAPKSIPVRSWMGGKTPCFVTQSCDLNLTAQKIVWAKFMNAGQNLGGLDYVYVHQDVQADLIEAMIQVLRNTYGIDPTHNPEYQSMHSPETFMRVSQLLNCGRIMWGGRRNPENLKIEPSIIDRVTWDNPLMKQPIRGPILPIMTYSNLNQAIERTCHLPVPSQVYFFSNDASEIQQFKRFGRFANLVVNDTDIMAGYPFWSQTGLGATGDGRFMGQHGFEMYTYPCVSLDAPEALTWTQRFAPYPNDWSKLK